MASSKEKLQEKIASASKKGGKPEDNFDENESQQVTDLAYAYEQFFEAQIASGVIDPGVMLEAVVLATALFICGTELTDKEIVDGFKEALAEARSIIEEESEEGEEGEEEEEEDEGGK
jgi:hypothetical protein